MITQNQLIVIWVFVLCGFLLPVLFFLFYHFKIQRLRFMPVLTGAVVFFLFAMVLEQLQHFFILKYNATTMQFFSNPWRYAVYGCLSAALYEETGRLIAFKSVLKRFRKPADGIAFGFGHGGIEFMIIGGLGAVSSLVIAYMIRNGTFDAMIHLKGVSAEQASTIKEGITSVGASNVLMGIGERILAMLLQIGMSVIVFYSVFSGKIKFYFLALALHASMDFFAALAQKGIISPAWMVEIILIVFVIIALLLARGFVKKMREAEKNQFSQDSPSA
ncbi:MAG: YhfC family intramembrane metalloprotease [Bacteroidetes bacterium]|nr:YhfC family intramembrane metalloprotease [Bacteroidota bacterium]